MYKVLIYKIKKIFYFPNLDVRNTSVLMEGLFVFAVVHIKINMLHILMFTTW